MGPVSKPSSICIKVTPVEVLPSKIAETTGDGPRYSGRREGCKFQHPYCGIESNSLGISFPYAATIIRLGLSSDIS